METNERCYSPDDCIPADQVDEVDGGEYRLLPEGVYPYTVIGYNRTRYEKSGGKIPLNCWGIEMTLLVGNQGETTSIKKTFWLTDSLRWTVARFLRSCGMRKQGEALNFKLLETAKNRAAKGKVKITNRQGTGKYAAKTYNEIKEFLLPDEANKQAADEDEDLF